jgi:hypothetical protein
MLAYRNERIENAMLFFAVEHKKKTGVYLSQTGLYKYLAFFEFRYLKKHGDMSLELHYVAMQRGPVPKETYDNRAVDGYFSLVKFEPLALDSGKTGYIVKPVGKFIPDYFAAAELEEMNSLIKIFARRGIGADIMSDASHQAITAWKKPYTASHNKLIDPIDEFDRNIAALPEESLHTEKIRYLTHRKMLELL